MSKKLTNAQQDKLLGAAQGAIHFVVEGNGGFPLDMLRYDLCWPASETDSRLIEASKRDEYRGRVRAISLKGLKYPTERRWESFGWGVVPS